MFHEYEIFLKQAAPCKLIDEEGLIDRWKHARKKKDEYLNTACGTILVDVIVTINDRHLVTRAIEKYNSQIAEVVEDAGRGGLFVPRGDILTPA